MEVCCLDMGLCINLAIFCQTEEQDFMLYVAKVAWWLQNSCQMHCTPTAHASAYTPKIMCT